MVALNFHLDQLVLEKVLCLVVDKAHEHLILIEDKVW
jgi:hypothetical protein